MIVHVQTTIQTVFGLLDDAGNVIAQDPVVATVKRFSEDGFAERSQLHLYEPVNGRLLMIHRDIGR